MIKNCMPAFCAILLSVSASSGQDSTPLASDLTTLKPLALSSVVDEMPYYTLRPSRMTELHENYFLLSPDADDAKFQLSFQYKWFPTDTRADWLDRMRLGLVNDLFQGIHFGYTQQSFWEIGASSSPFEDHNFNPEMFYRIAPDLFSGDSLQIGYWHSSNGRDEDFSRSLDRPYVQAEKKLDGGKYTARVRGWTIRNESSDNEDIEDYIGYADLSLVYLVKPENPEKSMRFRVTGRLGEDTDHSAVEIMASCPWFKLKEALGFSKGEKLNLNPQITVMFWDGYGESLLKYNEDNTSFRVGLWFPFKPEPRK